MCFSPVASFTASAGLAVIGILTLRETQSWREWPLASLPLLFALQQFTEGWVWLALLQGKSGAVQYWLIQIYAGFAGIAWPLIASSSIFLIEPDSTRRRLILPVFLAGAGLAAYTVFVIIRYGFSAEIAHACILYSTPTEAASHQLPLYIFSTCAAFFCSSERRIRWIGAVNIVTFLMAYVLYRVNLVSVWCFFSAIVSGLLYLYFLSRHRQRKPSRA